MNSFWQDLRYGWRMLLKHKGFTTVAVLTLALGIGANTAIFSVVKSVLLRPLPYAQADRLLQFRFYLPAINHEQASIALRDVVDWRMQSQSFERIGVYGYAVLNFSEGSLPEAIYGLRVSADLLPTLGVMPALGRYFSPEEDLPGRNHVIILSDDVWRRRFDADTGIIGKTIRANQEDYFVVGVMPPGFNFPLNMPTTAKLPSQQMAQMVRKAVAAVDNEQPVFLAAPLKDWVADSIARQRFGLLLLGLFGALALALAAVGIYGVVSYTATQLTREIGIRIALGARARDVLRLVIEQGMRPALLGVIIGLAAAFALTRLITSLLFGVSPTDSLTFLAVAVLLAGVALLACYIPARRATKVDPLVALRYE